MTLSAADGDNGLLERIDELAVLERSLAKARDGQGSLVLVSGEAGIGKTALARAFCDAHRGGTRVLGVFAIRCSRRARSGRCLTSPRLPAASWLSWSRREQRHMM